VSAVESGDRVEFIGFGIDDPYSRLRPGTRGTVSLIDDAGTIHVRWDDGSTIGLVQRPLIAPQPGFRPDRYRRVES
jgi:hypothetical protein